MRVHISLPASDLAKSQQFYSDLLGTSATKVRPDYLNYRLDEPSIHLALVKSATVETGPVQHFGVELPDADTFKSWQDRLAVNKVDRLDEPEAQCCYARGNKMWLTDPDGHRWEIWHRTGEYESLAPPEEDCCA